MKLKALQTITMLSKYFVYGVFVQVLLMNLLLAANTSAQKAVSVKEVDIAIEATDSNVKDLFNTLEQLTDFNIHYDIAELGEKLDKNISISSGKMKVSDLLIEISKQANVRFKQVNQDVSVVNLPKGLENEESTISIQLIADVDTSGKITDENGEGLPGASVVIKGTTNGTTTNLDGNFQLTAPDDAILTISFVGYQNAEVSVSGRSVIDVQMIVQAASLDEIVVTGYRGSQQRAIEVKKLSSTVVEAITPTDLGNYSDENLADALQRVPGLQVDRNDSGNGGGDRVSVRGVGPQFVNVTINGRTPMSSGTEGINDLRMFNLDVLPPEIIGGAMIYKTSEAHLVEPGLGGLVDFQTLRPLSVNYKSGGNTFGAINARADMDEISDYNIQPRISGLFGAKTKDNKLGAYISVIKSGAKRSYDAMFNRASDHTAFIDNTGDGYVDDTKTFLAASNTTYNPVKEQRDRLGISSGVQWKPSEKWEIMLDHSYSDYDNTSIRHLGRTFYSDILRNTVIIDGDGIDVDENGILRFLDTSKAYLTEDDGTGTLRVREDGSGNPMMANSRVQLGSVSYDNRTTVNIGGLNIEYKENGWTVAADLSVSSINFRQWLASSGIRRYFNVPYTLDLNGELPVVNVEESYLPNFNSASQANQFVNGNNVWDRNLSGSNHAFRLDLTKEINDEFTIKFGGRYYNSDVESREARYNSSITRPADEATAENQQKYLLPNITFMEGSNIGNFNSWPAIDVAAAQAYAAGAYDKRATGAFEGDFFNPNDDEFFTYRKVGSFAISENTTSLYGQLDFNSGLLSGNFGARAIKTDVTAKAFSAVAQNDPDNAGLALLEFGSAPTTVTSSRWDVTPTLNLKFKFSDKVFYRVSIVNSLSRPSLTDMAPRNTVSVLHPDAISYPQNGNIKTSNAALKPFSTWQVDNTFEMYNRFGGSFVVSAFYKQIDDFIQSQVLLDQPLSELGDLGLTNEAAAVLDPDILYDITTPVNFSNARVYGYEIGIRQPLSILSDKLEGFGLQANFTYVTSTFDKTLTAVFNSFPGTAKNNFNAVAYYENEKFGVRLAYTNRGAYLRNIGGGSDVRANAIFTDPSQQLNLRVNYSPIEKLQLSVSGVNLTKDNRRDFLRNDPTLFNRVVGKGIVLTLGARYSF